MPIATVMAWFVVTPAQAQEVSGYAELRGSYAAGVTGEPWQLVQRVRPVGTMKISDRVLVSTTVEATLTEGRFLTDEVDEALLSGEFGDLLDQQGITCTIP